MNKVTFSRSRPRWAKYGSDSSGARELDVLLNGEVVGTIYKASKDCDWVTSIHGLWMQDRLLSSLKEHVRFRLLRAAQIGMQETK